MPKLTKERKAEVCKEVRDYARAFLIPETADPKACCLYYAAAACVVVPRAAGLLCQVQGGTCSWPRLTPEQDDGRPTTNTHFSYQWEGLTIRNMALVAAGLLPEMHVWAVTAARGPDGKVDHETVEILDVTSGFFPAVCRKILKIDWPGVAPPAFVWDRPESVLRDNPGVVYAPDLNAVLTARELAREVLNSNGFRL